MFIDVSALGRTRHGGRAPDRSTAARALLFAALLPMSVIGWAPAGYAAPQPSTDPCAAPATVVVSGIPWAQQLLAPERVWRLTTGEGVTVAVVGSGVDSSVPQLAGDAVLPGVDTLANGARADTDCLGQGTFQAGIIAARTRDGVGFAGVAPGATILPVRVMTERVSVSSTSLAAGIEAAVRAGASIISLSYSTESSTELQLAVADAIARDVLIVAPVAQAASTDNRSTNFPAALPGVLRVGGINQSLQPSMDNLAGPVDVAAPANQILSLGTRGPGQLIGDGPGYAVPFVAGVAALVRAYRPTLSAAGVAARLRATADRPGTAVPNPQLGWGVVNTLNAVAAVLPGEPPLPAPTGRRAPAQPNTALPRPPDPWPANAARLFAEIATGLAIAAALGAAVLPAGRRRRWRPANRRGSA